MIDTIYNALGQTPNIEQLPMQEGDVDITYANIDKAKAFIGYEPKVSFEEGIGRFIKWYQALHAH